MNSNLSPKTIRAPVLVLIGPTAIGKTGLSLMLSETYNCEIISVDSMQVYRYMDIGTAKISETERRNIPHHLIDIVDPDDHYDAVRFAADCLQKIVEIHNRSAIPLITGGTGLYLKSLKEGFFSSAPTSKKIRTMLRQRLEKEGSNALHDELTLCDRDYADKIHPNDSSRIIRSLEVFLSTGVPLSAHHKQQQSTAPIFSNMLTLGLTCERSKLYGRIDQRSFAMLQAGFEHEVRDLLARGYLPDLKSMQSIGYRHMVNHLSGKWSEEELVTNLSRDTRRYAKRQYTWFNRDNSIYWFDRSENNKIISFTRDWLKTCNV